MKGSNSIVVNSDNPILKGINPTLAAKILGVIRDCAQKKINMVPSSGTRNPLSQGGIWKQGRSKEIVDAKIKELVDSGCNFLASCITKAVSKSVGGIVSNAIPGMSWHQWGFAVDCAWMYDGEKVKLADDWREIDGRRVRGYHIYAQTVRDHGLTSGGFFSSIKDYPHAQLYPEGNPLQRYGSIKEINDRLERIWKNKDMNKPNAGGGDN